MANENPSTTALSTKTGIPVESSSQILSTQHMDYIHHVAFDVYGRRMATCSGDRFVKVFDLLADGSWQLAGQWQAHKSAVAYISWSHPEFGTLIASGGMDHDVKIWEERSEQDRKTVWSLKAQLTDARRGITCVEFSPRHYGLQLATGSSDGVVRLYEAVDVLSLSQWPLQGSIQVSNSDPGVISLSWCTGRFEPPTLVVGASHLVIYRYISASRQWQSLVSLAPQGPVTCGVTSVAWAPNVGRRFHWIAAAENQRLYVYRFNREENNSLELESTQVLEDKIPVWKCQWNVTGTVLASAGDGSLVQLWKPFQLKNWKCVSQIYGDLGSPNTM